MYDYNNENELYNNEINDLTDIRLETEKYKNNKYNEDEIVMNENINLEEQNSINDENYINEDFVEQYDINNISNNINDEFDIYNNNNNLKENNNNNNFQEFNNTNENDEENLISENEEGNNFINPEENCINNNYNNNNNDIESLKLYIINLEKKCLSLEQENKMLKIKKENDPNFGIVENSIKQGTILLDDIKRKNFNLNKKIKILEKENQELNYKLIESNQKIKKIQNNNDINYINNNNKDINSNILKLNNKIDQNEIIISKLKFDKKLLETKLSEEKKNHENELNLMLNYKNSELSVYQKAIDDFKSQNNNIHLNSTNEINKMKTLKNQLKILSTKNKSFENNISILKNNLSKKDDIINSLNKKIIELEGNFNLKYIEMQQIKAENETQISKLINEKNELIKNNEKLSNGLLQFDNKVKEANMIFMNKTEFYDKSIIIFKNRIKEYKNKVILLKKKIKELNLIIENNNIQKLNNNNINIFKRNIDFTPNSFIIPKRKTTPCTLKFFDDKNDFIHNNSMNINMNRTYLDIRDNKNSQNNKNMDYLNKSQISTNNYFFEEDNNQKQYINNFKSFLTKLKI